jgi:hypothetical protein
MKRYKVVFRYICHYCSFQDDVVLFFDSLYSAKRCVALQLNSLQFDICFLIDTNLNKVLVKVQNF